MLSCLRQRRVLLSLGLVTLVILANTLLVFFWGPPFPYRVGEIYPHDIRVRTSFELINQVELVNFLPMQENAPIGDVPTPGGKANLEEELPSALEKYPSGMVLVQRNRPISERQLALLKEEHRAYHDSLPLSEYGQRAISMFLIFGCLAGLVAMHVTRFSPESALSPYKIATVGILTFVTIAAGLFASTPPWDAVFLPLTITAMILALAYETHFALVVSMSLAIAITTALDAKLDYLLVLMSGLVTGVLLLRNVRTRTQLVRVASVIGLVFLIITFATGLQSQQRASLVISDAVRRFFWGTLAGFLLTGLLPIVERVFGIVTDISLLELADGSHPLLQELVKRAPGTYTHSITVATLAETAAETIGANPLMTRVGAYFHDVGKMLKPQYFIENQDGVNRHSSLEPALSTLIIIGHVKDGLALAKQYGLPRPVVDFIEQHHGTTLVEYFYREALRLQGEEGPCNGELEASFRYPGPKPQNRENGILMLADAVESASRSLIEPTPTRIRKLVHELFMKRLLDGQFEESGLTLSELHLIEESLCKSLIALFHVRIKYHQDEFEPQPVG